MRRASAHCKRPGTQEAETTAGPRMHCGMLLLAAALIAATVSTPSTLHAQGAKPAAGKEDVAPGDKGRPENPFPADRPMVPKGALSGGVEWLNSAGEIQISDLKGKIVLVDFWTYCCINCMHILPDLKYLERKFPNELVVIGVHSAKFDNEKDSENIRRAIQRYEIEHPVVNDAEMTIWRNFNTRAWPTLALIDPEGRYLGSISGEGHRDLLEQLIEKLVVYHKAKGTLNTTPIKFALEREKLKPTPLRFPGKLLADESGKRIFISDSNHNRIVIASLGGKLLDIIGTGEEGAKNGSYTEATFNHPQGMELVGETLYVADTENHLIRSVDLEKKTVDTFAGTGQQARFGADGGKRPTTPISSPWDLKYFDEHLYIAMAGPHQIWVANLKSDKIGVYAGSGREDILNGALHSAALAQPSGLTTDGDMLFVVDSEGSAVRKIGLGKNAGVTTIAGTHDLENGRSLFEFGDVDGELGKSRLQHPLGLAYANGLLYIADTYNHKIKRLDLKSNKVASWLGDGKRGDEVGPPRFSEPGGLAIADGKLFIADTNNHVIKTADLKSSVVTLFPIEGLSPPTLAPPTVSESVVSDESFVRLDPIALAAGEAVRFQISFKLPEEYKLNALAGVKLRIKPRGEQSLISPENLAKRHAATIDNDSATVTVPANAQGGKGTYELSLDFGYCRDGVGGLCKVKSMHWLLPLEVAEKGEPAIRLTAEGQ